MGSSQCREAEQQAIADMHAQGLSAKEICRETGRSYGTVLRYLKAQRVLTTRRGPWDMLTPEQQQQCRHDYGRGYSLSYLKDVYGVQAGRLRQAMDDAGIQNPSQHTTGIERLHDCRDHVVADYTTDAVGVREMARRFGVHEGTMRTFLQQEVGLKPRGAQPGDVNPMSKGRVDAKDRDCGKYWARRTVELALGRKLPKGWVIHHMNESPRDQRHANLWLFPGSDAHAHYHRQQSEHLAAGGLVPASQTASENGGLWLPELLVLLKSEPERVGQLLCDRQE
jgi:transposase